MGGVGTQPYAAIQARTSEQKMPSIYVTASTVAKVSPECAPSHAAGLPYTVASYLCAVWRLVASFP